MLCYGIFSPIVNLHNLLSLEQVSLCKIKSFGHTVTQGTITGKPLVNLLLISLQKIMYNLFNFRPDFLGA